MDKHDLLDERWCFEFDNAKRRLGCCKFRNKTISFSKHYLPVIKHEEMVNTILHEIAHALVGPRHGHDNVWKRKAIEIGCDGKRLYKGEAKTKPNYVATCWNCGKVFHRYRMRTDSRLSCGICTPNRFDAKYLLTFKLVK